MKTFLRNTQGELIAMKREIIEKCLSKQIKSKEAAGLLKMHPKAFSRFKKRYKDQGDSVLIPRKPGPKHGRAPNRTLPDIENLVVKVALTHRAWGPVTIADALNDWYKIKLNQATVWRILKRRRCRYQSVYEKAVRDKPQLYCLDEPGAELQLDGCYPYGRGRKIVCFDALDDCSRWAYGQLYQGFETTDKAIDFVSRLIKVAPFRIQTIRIDNRLGKLFDQYCQKQGITIIRNNPYDPTQNGKIERYHRSIKQELFFGHFGYLSEFETLTYKLKQWLDYYNSRRRHGGYGMDRMTPNGKISSILAKKMLNSLLTPNYPQKVTLSMQQYRY